MSLLFRKEALEAKNDSLLGSIRVGRRLDFSLMTGISLALGAGLIAFCTFGEITRKAHVSGVLVPAAGALQVIAASSGTIVDLPVQEGQQVRQGAVLATLGMDRSTGQGDTVELVLQNIDSRAAALEAERRSRAMLGQQRQEALAARVRSLAAQVQRSKDEVDLARQRVDLAEQGLQRFTRLAGSGFVSGMQAQQKQEEFLDTKARQHSAERNRDELLSQLDAFTAEQRQAELQLNTELGEVERGLAALRQERIETEARRRLVIRATRDGVVSGLTVKPGQAINAGQTLGVLLPTDHQGDVHLQAQLYAPSRTRGFVQPGQTVWLRYAAFPYQKFGMAQGEVSRISSSPIAPQDLPAGQAQALLAGAQANEPLYRIEVRLKEQSVDAYGKRYPLVAGMALEGDVVQDRRRVWELVLDPLLAARARHGTL
ncbi:HlyD family secretion protein [Massilia sp. AB1]|uniref:HlyD family secretion protein n=1 Tax=Massilia sp. AB1 TaxID=2823371 RepID=UPI001B842E11|nr:HlyD family efflux transporter periplasmic adaptor subunit [Massilia sp. AB1]MBQ5940038.1 HlyD family efflux transporter periplasmic adaptor subunit [Massilia sp. AB1]